MKKTLVVFVVILLCYGAPAAQDLPPDMLADQYLLAATTALQNQDRQAAINAFQKIEALDITPPAEFFYFYGKVLVEDGVATNTVPSIEKGQSLLKKYIVASGREVEHYRSALEVLNTAGDYQDPVARINTQMVRVEGGIFTMECREGLPDCESGEAVAVRVRMSSFEISKYEVTQELWEAVMGENPSRFKHCPQCPVECVSWNDVQVFLQKLNVGGGRYRLPSEAEWEYAAVGGQRSRRYRYSGSDNPNAVAWHQGNSGGKTHPVGQKQANELGLYDMSGNVFEFVQDCWERNHPPRVSSDGRAWGQGDCSNRVQRGGSYVHSPWGIRHYLSRPGYPVHYVVVSDGGFRLARSLP